jgi:hypothetical protein
LALFLSILETIKTLISYSSSSGSDTSTWLVISGEGVMMAAINKITTKAYLR